MNTTDFTKKTGMVETHDGLKLYVVRNNASAEPKAVLIILHGLANEHSLYDVFVHPFNQQTGAKDKSLRIYAGVNHFLMNDPKGKMIAGDVIGWMEDRLGDEVYEDAGI